MSASNDDIEPQDHYKEADDVVGVDDRTEFSCALQQAYVTSGNQKEILFLLCLGLCLSDTDDTPLFSFQTEPWSPLPKTEMWPVNPDYAKEVVRRSRVLHRRSMPCPLNWPKSQKIEWLQANPLQDNIDILFLRSEVLRLKDILERLLTEEQHQRKFFGSQWCW
jgi:hypothetical protein